MPSSKPSPEGLALDQLLRAAGVTQVELARRLGLSKSVLSEYITGKRSLPPALLEEWALQAGHDREAVEEALESARALLGELDDGPAGSPLGPDAARRRHLRRIARAAGRQARETAYTVLVRADPRRRIREERRRAAALWAQLKGLSPRGWRALLLWRPELATWALCERLCEESERAAPHKAARALELAELALWAADRMAGDAALRARVRRYCLAFAGNARRVGNDLREASRAFRELHRLPGGAVPGEEDVLDEARVLDLEASLQRGRRRFTRALELHDAALALTPGRRRAYILLNKSATLEQKGDYESSVRTLREAAPLVDARREPRQLFGLKFNLAVNLCHAGRAVEAVVLYLEVEELAGRLQNDLDQVRVLWLRGKIAAGEGRRGQALEDLERVRRNFMERRLPYDTALVTLEMAVLLADQGRTREVKALAQKTAPLFQAQDVDREALACFLLFQKAAEREALTAALAQGLLHRLRCPHELR